jgi:NAD(P)H-hydrate repair Nnr-like enzyme with NAD(P)H-hydrate dehydratase domain
MPPAAQLEVAMQITAVMLKRVKDASAFDTILEDPRINTLCLGPGLGLGDEKRGFIEVALKSGRACVLDADALTLIAGSPTLFGLLHANCILTPHGGEFARLFPDIASTLDESCTQGKADAVGLAAAKAGCIVLLKGVDIIIAEPSGACLHHQATENRAVPSLATAGAGDVLAGFISGLLARGIPPL